MNKGRITKILELTLQILFFLWCLVLPWSTAGMQIMLGLLILDSVILSIINKRSPVNFHPFYIFIAAYFVSDLISILHSENASQSFNAAFSNDWVLITVPFIVSLAITPLWRKRSFRVLLFSASIVGLVGIIQAFIGVDFLKGGSLVAQGNYFRAIGSYSGYYTYGGNQLFAFAISFAFLILVKKWKIERGIYLLFAVIIFFSIVASFTRSTWLGAIFVLLLGTLMVNRKVFLYMTGALLLVGIILFHFVPDIQSRFLSIFSESQNEERITLWATAWIIIKKNFMFGIGQGFFPKYFLIYKVPGFFDAHSHAHNDFINVTVSNGILGFITWTGMWVSWFYYSTRAFMKKNWEEADRQIILSAILGIAGILVAAMFQCFFTDLENNVFWLSLASVALQIVIQSKKKTVEKL